MKKIAKANPAGDSEAKRKSEIRNAAEQQGAMLQNEHAQKVAFLAKSLSDENRLKILLCVSAGKKPVSGIVEEMGLSQPLVSHHLKELKRSLLVTVERSGPFIYYKLVDPRILDVVQILSDVATDLLAARRTF